MNPPTQKEKGLPKYYFASFPSNDPRKYRVKYESKPISSCGNIRKRTDGQTGGWTYRINISNVDSTEVENNIISYIIGDNANLRLLSDF